MRNKLKLKAEALADLTTNELGSVAGGESAGCPMTYTCVCVSNWSCVCSNLGECNPTNGCPGGTGKLPTLPFEIG